MLCFAFLLCFLIYFSVFANFAVFLVKGGRLSFPFLLTKLPIRKVMTAAPIRLLRTVPVGFYIEDVHKMTSVFWVRKLD